MIPDLKEIRNNVIKLQNRLMYLLNQKQINFERTQPHGVNIKDTLISSTNNFVDTFALYMIKDEKLDAEIQDVRDSYYNWLDYYNKEIKRLSNYDDVLMIEILRNELRWKWEQIDSYLNYGTDVSRKKYEKHIRR